MKKDYKKLSMTLMLAIATFVALTISPFTVQAGNGCNSDQQQLQNNGAILFGGSTVLGQTFVPSVAGMRICKVKLMIRKNVAAGDDLRLHILRSDFTPLDAPVTIPGVDIPMGDSVQLFDFGCNGAPLIGSPFYGLKLESPGSPLGAYSWRGNAGNPYIGGIGWRNVNNGAAGKWNNLGGWDYAFQIYLCD